MKRTAHPSRISFTSGLTALCFLILGIGLLVWASAATSVITGEAESGTLAGNAKNVGGTGTSGSGAVAFAAGSGGSPSGEPMPTGNLAGWKLVFSDDFTTTVPVGQFPAAVSSKWRVYPDGWPDTSRNGTYSPSKVLSVSNGLLNMYLHTENGVHMVAAPVPIIPGATGAGGGQQYGRYSVRFRADPVHGYKTAWLLWPDSETWPRDGEIDFPEGNLDGTIYGFMHRQNGTSGGDQDGYSSTVTYANWHTATIEWSPTRLNFILDGNTIGSSTDRIPNTPMHWVLQTETGLDGYAPTDDAAGNVQIDWVAVWSAQ